MLMFNRSGAVLQAQPGPYFGGRPSFHVLDSPPRLNGDTVTASWVVVNAGTLDGSALLSLQVGSQTVQGLPLVVPAGFSVNLTVNLILAGQPESTTVNGVLEMLETSATGIPIASIDTHNFTVVMDAPPVGLLMQAIGEPTIF